MPLTPCDPSASLSTILRGPARSLGGLSLNTDHYRQRALGLMLILTDKEATENTAKPGGGGSDESLCADRW